MHQNRRESVQPVKLRITMRHCAFKGVDVDAHWYDATGSCRVQILDILVNDLKLKLGDPVPDQQLKQKYRDRNGDSGDIKKGLEYTEQQEWMSHDGPPTFTSQLTELGHESA